MKSRACVGFRFMPRKITGKLVSKGYRVAICEQVEDPAEAKVNEARCSESGDARHCD